jgi:lipopolysaccharide transport system permease protein
VRTLLVLVLALWLIVFVGGCGLIVAALTVRARDVSSALPFLLQLLLFLSPVGYPAGALPHGVRTLFSLNPLSGLMQALRWSALGVPIDGGTVAISGALTVLLAGVAWWLFTRLEPFVADDI